MLTPTLRRGLGAVAPVFLAVSMAACGDDSGTTTTAAAGPGDIVQWCAGVIDFDEHIASLPTDVSEDEFRQQIAEVLPMFSVLVAGAPGAIRDQVVILRDGFDKIAAGDDSPMFDPDYAAAFGHFEDFVVEVCDYEMQG